MGETMGMEGAWVGYKGWMLGGLVMMLSVFTCHRRVPTTPAPAPWIAKEPYRYDYSSHTWIPRRVTLSSSTWAFLLVAFSPRICVSHLPRHKRRDVPPLYHRRVRALPQTQTQTRHPRSPAALSPTSGYVPYARDGATVCGQTGVCALRAQYLLALPDANGVCGAG